MLHFCAWVVIIAVYAIKAVPLMLLWNALLPELFGLKEISFLQAFGLLLLWFCFSPVRVPAAELKKILEG